MADRPAARLRKLEGLRFSFAAGASVRKRELLTGLAAAGLDNPTQVLRLHEVLCFMRAYPDDPALLAQVEDMLEGFVRRTDLRRHRKSLADSGIAGTSIHYEFYHRMAVWLADRWPDRLRIDWPQCESVDAIENILPHLGLFNESPALDEQPFTARQWLDRMKGPAETAAAFLVRRIAKLKMDPFLRERFFEGLAVPMVIDPGPGGPSRTGAWSPIRPPHFQTGPLRRGRPDLAAELKRSCPDIRFVHPPKGEELLDLCREALVTRSRDLDAFAFGDVRDVRLADCGDGLTVVFIGMVPERRLMFETVYGYVLLKNGVPLGYGVISALFRSVEVAFNVFDTFRGVEAGFIFTRLLTTLRHMFKARTFTLFPYQLGGEGNEEGLASGAWWFYQKLGFRPRDGELLELMNVELDRMRKSPGHRSSRGVLKRLAAENVYYDLGKPRRDVIGELPLANIGTHLTDYLAGRFGSRRDRAAAVCGKEAAGLLGIRPSARFSIDEKLAWGRWAPLVMILPGVEGWPQDEKRALVEVIRAKGGRRESDFTLKFDAHTKLR
ncbi:MAG: hypothetical protein ABFS42_08260, partial [Candidatus Krumholzibacteriota bacterium]